MAMYLSHTSALSRWLFDDGRCFCDVTEACVRNLDAAACPSREFEAHDLVGKGVRGDVVHVLVSQPDRRYQTKQVRRHVWSGAIPRGAFLRLHNDCLISSPEFTLLQMAPHLDAVQRAWVASIMCSHFVPVLDDLDEGMGMSSTIGFRGAEPVTSVARLESFARQMQGAYGCNPFQTSLRYACEGATSPMEVAIAMMSAIPRRLGGYGIGNAKLNAEITLRNSAARLCGKQVLYVDFLFPDKVVCEYDSKQFHAGADSLRRDRERYNALVAMGYRPLGITKECIGSITKIDAVFDMIIRLSHRRRRPISQSSAWERQSLLSRLLDLDSREMAGIFDVLPIYVS